ncbi:hypothetical protein [Janthinobacterium sp. UMAB-60]|uniref:hypothetical protein n=1 Tax=Janthinobacterium sp. UMAB-60 TaxID=1365365 RepID=UPI001C576055|nr:hypothetical protein [Janthinobacterium sp. UMAB-60]
MNTQINISYNVESDEMRDKTELVFLKPQNPQSNYQIPAWQVLKGVPGPIEAFVYDHQIPLDVRSHGAALTKTNPYSQFDSDWYVNATPVVTTQPVDAHSATATEGDVTLNRNQDR